MIPLALPSLETIQVLVPGRLLRHVVTFTVPGPPVPKQRPQVTERGTYYPARTRGSTRLSYPEYKELVQGCFCQAMAEEWFDIRFHHLGQWLLWVVAAANRGDFDNVAGSVADALQGLLWRNDSQIHEAHQTLIRKVKTAEQGILVAVWELEERV